MSTPTFVRYGGEGLRGEGERTPAHTTKLQRPIQGAQLAPTHWGHYAGFGEHTRHRAGAIARASSPRGRSGGAPVLCPKCLTLGRDATYASRHRLAVDGVISSLHTFPRANALRHVLHTCRRLLTPALPNSPPPLGAPRVGVALHVGRHHLPQGAHEVAQVLASRAPRQVADEHRAAHGGRHGGDRGRDNCCYRCTTKTQR